MPTFLHTLLPRQSSRTAGTGSGGARWLAEVFLLRRMRFRRIFLTRAGSWEGRGTQSSVQSTGTHRREKRVKYTPAPLLNSNSMATTNGETTIALYCVIPWRMVCWSNFAQTGFYYHFSVLLVYALLVHSIWYFGYYYYIISIDCDFGTKGQQEKRGEVAP